MTYVISMYVIMTCVSRPHVDGDERDSQRRAQRLLSHVEAQAWGFPRVLSEGIA